MSNCFKLMKLDILSVGLPWLTVTLIYALVVNICIVSFMPDFLILCVSSQTIATMALWSFFGLQERDKFTVIYSTLPVNKKQIVMGRYISMIVIFLIFFAKDIAIYAGLTIFKKMTWDFVDLFQGFCLSFLVFAIVSTIMPPLYKFGVMKAVAWFAVMFFILVAGFAVLVITAENTLPNLLAYWDSHRTIITAGSILLSSIIFYFSYRAAIVAYRKRSWN